ncbi:hypothetical protein TYRP_017417 [Tyrophagus putrescentiae]|nr:hypothetical protein TYRP_017417 [Tyrophagus putrescentiae]
MSTVMSQAQRATADHFFTSKRFRPWTACVEGTASSLSVSMSSSILRDMILQQSENQRDQLIKPNEPKGVLSEESLPNEAPKPKILPLIPKHNSPLEEVMSVHPLQKLATNSRFGGSFETGRVDGPPAANAESEAKADEVNLDAVVASLETGVGVQVGAHVGVHVLRHLEALLSPGKAQFRFQHNVFTLLGAFVARLGAGARPGHLPGAVFALVLDRFLAKVDAGSFQHHLNARRLGLYLQARA